MLFTWVATHVDYAADEFFSGARVDCAPEALLASRRAVCAGYAALFVALARAAGLGDGAAREVAGWSKGFGFVAGADPCAARPNHAWVVVEIGGDAYFCDPTWAAGHLDGDRFVRRCATDASAPRLASARASTRDTPSRARGPVPRGRAPRPPIPFRAGTTTTTG